jgi:hypothetical protein
LCALLLLLLTAAAAVAASCLANRGVKNNFSDVNE